MTKKRFIVVLVALLLVTVCFSACITREDVEVYLDWGTYRQTVKVKYGATVNAKTVPYLDFDFVEGLYDDAEYTVGYNNQSITQSRVVFVKTNTKYPLEKDYFEPLDREFEEETLLIRMNKTFQFETELQTAIEKQGVIITDVYRLNYDYEERLGKDDFRRLVRLRIFINSEEELIEAIKTIEQFPQIYRVNLNYVIELASSPNDEYYVNNELWGLNGTNGINMPAAWNITQGSKKVRVGVLDTGIARHTDLDANVAVGRNFWNYTTDTDDTDSHGTHVAGTIGAIGNNGEGVVGVNWNVTLVPLKVVNGENKLFHLGAVEAITWAKQRWGTSQQIDIINYSLSGFGWDKEVLAEIKDYPGLFVWAAGNSNANFDEYSNIAAFKLPNLISVGAINSDGEKLESSNYGKTTVDVFAPGGGIYSTVLHNSYGIDSGTSMAAPHVTGVAALLLAKYPNLTAAQLKTIILNNVDKSDKLADYCISGGRLNAYKALKSQEVPPHTHSYTSKYVWINTKQHKATCECGATSTQGHAVSVGGTIWLSQYKTCLLCGGRAEYGYVIWEPNNEAIVFVTDNGSFILPNGVVVLVDADIQAYIDGTLKFYDKNSVSQ